MQKHIYITEQSTRQDWQEEWRRTHDTCIQAKEAPPPSVSSVRRVGRITSCRTYIVNTEKNSILKWDRAHFLIPPPPMGPPLAAKSQLPIRLKQHILHDGSTPAVRYESMKERDIPVFFKASSSAFSFFLSSQLNPVKRTR
jgi:hypothetical protein